MPTAVVAAAPPMTSFADGMRGHRLARAGRKGWARPLEDEGGERVDLLGIRGGGEEDELVAAGLLERALALAHLVLALGGAGDGEVRVLGRERVVVADRAARLCLGVRVEREVAERHRTRLLAAAGGLERGHELLARLGERLRGSRAHDPAVAEPGGAFEASVHHAAEDPWEGRRRRPARSPRRTLA